ncbi:uncharacterized protein LOC133806655 [Humulus lupulus]|uniref:uncharacterized protein LOC133806655 n=1 Tax=Humulus lupulus TaxID=3486 RepID=UPI002B40278C|nr:uncharacterized protein LOC133806655 [Humulus lupulus]
MRADLIDNFGIEATNRRLWKARRKAKGDVGGGYVHSYANLRRYATMIHSTNPRSVANVQSQLVPVNIDDDGCHLKGSYKGIFLAAVGVDANHHFYPLAYAIVEVENTDSWSWFLELLRGEIGDSASGHPWCIMTQLRDLFWETNDTSNFDTFKHIMDKVKEFNSKAHEWLSNIDFNHWTLSKFDTRVKVRGIPCIHAAACISKIRANIEGYCSPYFTTEMWRKSFMGVIHPIADESMRSEFDDDEFLPPVIKVQVGSLEPSAEEMHLSEAALDLFLTQDTQ